MPQRTQVQYSRLGLVVLFNMAVLVAVWCKVGWHFFGLVGLLVPGLAVPLLMAVGLDGLIAMRRRRLTGEFSELEPKDGVAPRSDRVGRLALATVFSALTTYTFMLDLAADPIRIHQQKQADIANQGLREELVGIAHAPAAALRGHAEARLSQIAADRLRLNTAVESARTTAAAAHNKAQAARDEAAGESGGLDGKALGKGPRYDAQIERADNNQRAAQAAAQDAALLAGQLAAMDNEATTLRSSINTAEGGKASELASVNTRMKQDPRYQAPASGLFAEATSFLALYADPEKGPGQWLTTLLLFPFLLGLECAALIAFSLNPVSPIDVRRLAGNREEASRIVTQSTLAIVNDRSKRPPVAVRAAAGPAAAVPPGATAQAGPGAAPASGP